MLKFHTQSKPSKKKQYRQQQLNKHQNIHHKNVILKQTIKQRGHVKKRKERDERILPFEVKQTRQRAGETSPPPLNATLRTSSERKRANKGKFKMKLTREFLVRISFKISESQFPLPKSSCFPFCFCKKSSKPNIYSPQTEALFFCEMNFKAKFPNP